MNYETAQQNIEMKAQREYLNQLGADIPCRVGLREAVESQLGRAYSEAAKAERMRELAILLDKNPDIARILDLIDEVRL